MPTWYTLHWTYGGPLNDQDRSALTELLQLIQLEQLEVNLFRGASRDIGTPRVFGGQVLAQAVLASAGAEVTHVTAAEPALAAVDRAIRRQEEVGLDLAQHGERAYAMD